MAKFLDSFGLGTLWEKLKTKAQWYVEVHASNTEAHKALLAGKADLVDGKVKSDQLPPIKTDQVVEQTSTPTSPDTILWVDPDGETPGVDVEVIREEAELAHTTADSAITRLNTVDEEITNINNTTATLSSSVSALDARTSALEKKTVFYFTYLPDDEVSFPNSGGIGGVIATADNFVRVDINFDNDNEWSTNQYIDIPLKGENLYANTSFTLTTIVRQSDTNSTYTFAVEFFATTGYLTITPTVSCPPGLYDFHFDMILKPKAS